MTVTRRKLRSPSRVADPVLVQLGERVRDLRAIRGMSRKTLARDAGVSERFLADLESGVGNASILLLTRLAQALALPVTDLLGGERDQSTTRACRSITWLIGPRRSSGSRKLTGCCARDLRARRNPYSAHVTSR